MKYKNKIYVDGVCIDCAKIDEETAIKIQELISNDSN